MSLREPFSGVLRSSVLCLAPDKRRVNGAVMYVVHDALPIYLLLLHRHRHVLREPAVCVGDRLAMPHHLCTQHIHSDQPDHRNPVNS